MSAFTIVTTSAVQGSEAAEVNTLRVTQGALAGEVARIDWTLPGDSAAFAEALDRMIREGRYTGRCGMAKALAALIPAPGGPLELHDFYIHTLLLRGPGG